MDVNSKSERETWQIIVEQTGRWYWRVEVVGRTDHFCADRGAACSRKRAEAKGRRMLARLKRQAAWRSTREVIDL